MKKLSITHQCITSLIVLWLVRSLWVLPLLCALLAYFVFELHAKTKQTQLTNIQLSQELRLLRQSMKTATQSQPMTSTGFASDKAHVIRALSHQVGEGLGSIEFPPVQGTKLKSILIEGNDMFVEYELPSLQTSTLVTESLNGNAEAKTWGLESITTSENTVFAATRYVGKWRRKLPKP